jgi:hypothetical protein
MSYLDQLLPIVSVVYGLSVATERLVEITKGLIPFLNKRDPKTNPMGLEERYRRAAIQLLAVLCGVGITELVRPMIMKELPGSLDNGWSIVTLGLLASGGSSLWNSVLSYLEKVKSIAGGVGSSPAPTGGAREGDAAPVAAAQARGGGTLTAAGAGG